MPILSGEEAQCAGGAEDTLKNIRKKGTRSNCWNVTMTVSVRSYIHQVLYKYSCGRAASKHSQSLNHDIVLDTDRYTNTECKNISPNECIAIIENWEWNWKIISCCFSERRSNKYRKSVLYTDENLGRWELLKVILL